MKKIDVLRWGVKHIAENHEFKSFTEDDGEYTFSIFGVNIPTLSDVRMMCEDLGIPLENVYYNPFGIDIEFEEWAHEQGYEEYKSGIELWRRTKENINRIIILN